MPDVDRRTRIQREATVRAVRAEGEDETALPSRLEIVVATADPVRIWGVDEVLSMKKGAVDLKRFRNNAPFLVDHDNRIESIIGRIENPRIDGDRLLADVVLADTDRARAYAALVAAHMATKISVGFSVREWKLTRPRDDEHNEVAEFTAVHWAPHEASAVAVPADDRAAVEGHRIERIMEDAMPPDEEEGTTARSANASANSDTGDSNTGRTQVRRRSAQMGGETIAGDLPQAVLDERERVRQLREYGREFESIGGPDIAAEVETAGGTLTDLKHEIAKKNEEIFRAQAARNEAAGHVGGATGDGDPGLSTRDIAQFSFVRAASDLLVVRDNPSHNSHELDVMRAANQRIRDHNARQTAGGFTIPSSILQFGADRRRVLEAGSGDGANLVATDLGSFAEYLRADSVVVPLATPMPDMVGNYDIPRQDGTINPIWRQEGDAASNVQDQSFDQIELRPKEMILGTTVTRRFLHQPQVGGEMLIRQDFGAVAALGIDYAALLGSGQNGQPQGVAKAIELGEAPDTGTGGASANTMSWAVPVQLERALNDGNGLKGNLAYITNPGLRAQGKLAVRGGAGSGVFVIEDNESNGYPVLATSQIPKTFSSKSVFTGGDKSPILFGNWRDVIVATWVGGDLVVNPFTEQMRARVTISMHLMVDVAVRHTASFAGYWDLDT